MIEGLTWIAVKASLKKLWALCKKYWQICLGAAIPLILMIIFRKKGDLSGVLDRARDDHKKEVDVINKIHQDEIKAREEAQKRYFDTIRDLEEKYKQAQGELESKKKKQVQKILKENADNPEEITRRIAELTGFEIYVK